MIKTSRKIQLIQVRKECGATLSAGKSNSLVDSMTTFEGTWGLLRGLGARFWKSQGCWPGGGLGAQPQETRVSSWV